MNIFGKKEAVKANSLVIRNGTLNFEDVKGPPGFPITLKNDGKQYHLLIENSKKLKEYLLPDTFDYYDPGEYANVISMPAHKKLFERQQNLIEKLSPIFLIVAMIVVGVIFAIVGG